ncbi:GntR family transcriptional regulator [Longispora sp. K20-0274]
MTGPRFLRLAAELRERISLGDYAASGGLESEAELGRRHDVSRVTVRRALEQLRDEGLIAARRGSGWFVISGASFGQSIALGSFQHAGSAVSEAGVPLVRRVSGYEYRPAPADVARLLGQVETLRVQAVRFAGAHPLDVVTEWVPLEFAAPVSRADAEEPGVCGDPAPQRARHRRRPAEHRRDRRQRHGRAAARRRRGHPGAAGPPARPAGPTAGRWPCPSTATWATGSGWTWSSAAGRARRPPTRPA